MNYPKIAQVLVLSILFSLAYTASSTKAQAQNKKPVVKKSNKKPVAKASSKASVKSGKQLRTEAPLYTPAVKMSHAEFLDKLGVKMSPRCKRIYLMLVEMDRTLHWPGLMWKVYKGYNSTCDKELFGVSRKTRVPTTIAAQWFNVEPMMKRMIKSKGYRKFIVDSIQPTTPFVTLTTLKNRSRGRCPKGMKKVCGLIESRATAMIDEARKKGLYKFQTGKVPEVKKNYLAPYRKPAASANSKKKKNKKRRRRRSKK